MRWPRRRARLPGRGRALELLSHPKSILRLSRPGRLRRIGRIADDERLIGLLMIRDESDVAAESLAAATRWFDRVLVLDGTTDPEARRRTDEILAAHTEVVFVARDDELPGTTTRDGARQHLLAEARRRYGVDNWIGILHADECIDQDPRPMLAVRHPVFHPAIRVRLAHAFLHTDDEVSWDRLAQLPVRERVRHVMWPGVPETRFFFDTGDRDYDFDRHAKVMPRSFRAGPLIDGFVVVQYNERSPEQVRDRARQRTADDWQTSHYGRFLSDYPQIFTPSLDRAESPFAPEFAGDPEGPFRAVHLDEVPHGPEPGRPEPLLVVAGTDGVDTEDRVVVDLRWVVAPGGLLDLVDSPRRVMLVRWHLRMRDLGTRGWGRAANGGLDERPGYRALLRHTRAILASSRSTRQQRRTVARELISRLQDPLGGSTGWTATIPEHRRDSLEAVLHRARPESPESG